MQPDLTIDDAAAIINVNPSTVRTMIHNEAIPSYRAGGVWRIPREQFNAWRNGTTPQGDHPMATTQTAEGTRARLRSKGIEITSPIKHNDSGGFATGAEFFGAVRACPSGVPPVEVSHPKLSPWTRKAMQATAGTDEQSTFSDPHGGFLIPPALLGPEILSRTGDGDPLVGRTTFVPMPVNSVLIPYRVDSNHTDSVSGGFAFCRTEQGAAITLSRGEIGLLNLRAKSLYGLCYASLELPEQVSAALVEGGFAIEFGSQRFRDRIHGTGVGEPLGVLNSGALITIDAEVGQGADTFLYQNATAMAARCWGYDYGAVWLVNPELRGQVYAMNAAANAPIWTPPQTEGEPGLLLARPLYFSEEMSTVGDVGDVVLMNPSQYLDGEYEPIQSTTSLYVRFVEHQRAYKVWHRGDGCPWWDAALTPKNGTATLSPFVTLEAR